MEVKNQFDPDLRKFLKKRKQTAIIPVGSLEQHGPHLPVSTDSDIVTEVAKRVSKKCNFLLLPTINYGNSFEHSPFFNLSINNSTLQRILIDIGNSLVANKISSLFILNGHHGNQVALRKIPKKIQSATKRKLKVFVLSYWHFMKSEFDHAGFVETSLMCAISNNVNMKKAIKGLVTKNMSKKEKSQLSKLASKSFPKATKNGVWGDPRRANAKDGRKFLSEIVKNVASASQTCLTEKNPKLHQ